MAPRTRKTETRRPERRTEALTRERIVAAAVELLDASGEGGLTFRALTERLATGPGAVYHHVANKNELVEAATDAVIAGTLDGGTDASREAAGPTAPTNPRDAIRAVALGLFDAIEAHPWLAPQLALQFSRSPWGPVAPRILESIGRHVRDLGVPEESWFTAASALVHYVLGAAGQNAANVQSARDLPPGSTRGEFLDTAARAWQDLDPGAYPFTRAVAARMREHDDRAEFLAGVALVLAGITAAGR